MMNLNMNYRDARDMLVSLAKPVSAEKVILHEACGRVLAQELTASENVPAFDRSPYDGYAFRAEDTKGASKDHPVTLQVIEEVPAGSTPSMAVRAGTAVKILTGAPIPEGADAVVMYEKTVFDETKVTLFHEASSGENIIYAGEDVKKGAVLAEAGIVIDPGLSGVIAGQGILYPQVYEKPSVGIISTGTELVELEDIYSAQGADSQDGSRVPAGKIINTNQYTLAAALRTDGCRTVFLGSACDDAEQIAALIRRGLYADGAQRCDMIVITGGVSAGDYDLTPDAMEKAGCRLLAKGVRIKPGMACCYGTGNGKPVCALSGNPASSLINYYTVVRPAVRKMTGRKDYMPQEITVALAQGFGKKSKVTRFLKGRLRLADSSVQMDIPEGQGNVMISSSVGCNIIAEVPEGSGPVPQGTELKGFMIF